MAKKELSVGELLRSGLPVSTLHFYERKGCALRLLASTAERRVIVASYERY